MDRQFAREDLGDSIAAVLREVHDNGSATITENGKPSVRLIPALEIDREACTEEEHRFESLHRSWTADAAVTAPWTRAELYER